LLDFDRWRADDDVRDLALADFGPDDFAPDDFAPDDFAPDDFALDDFALGDRVLADFVRLACEFDCFEPEDFALPDFDRDEAPLCFVELVPALRLDDAVSGDITPPLRVCPRP
jgi:hypothetical protein